MDQELLKTLEKKSKPEKKLPISVSVKKAVAKTEVKLNPDLRIRDMRDVAKELIDRKKLLENITDIETDINPVLGKTSPVEKSKVKKTEDKKPVIKKTEDEKKVKLTSPKDDVSDLPVTKSEKTKKTKEPKPDIVVETTDLSEIPNIDIRMPKKGVDIIKQPGYYMNNREIFIKFMNALLRDYKSKAKSEKEEYNCDTKTDGKFNLLTHQQIVKDYINQYTPYRGVLLYHGLGSGKTCSSIGIAEGLKLINV